MEQSKRLHCGLYNQGATCYLNSVLQVLFMTAEIHDRLDPELQTDHQLGKIFEELKKKTCGTQNITTTFEIKDVYQQQDAAEYLEMILRKISSQASEVFQVKLKYTTMCSEGHNIRNETIAFWTVPLSLKDIHGATYSVEKSFERIFQERIYNGDNKVHCSECNMKTEATYGCEMVKSPQILTLLLKRFDFDYNTMSHFKSDRCVDVPLTLQIKKKTYKLYGMVNHRGSLRGGHYTAILSNEDETWYECNDAYVNKVKEQPFATAGIYSSRTVYLLMYRATESQTYCDTNSEDLKDNALQKQDDTSNLDEPMRDEVECTENEGKRDTDDEERQTKHSEEDEEQMRKKQTKEDFSHQTGEEEGDAESVKKDISVIETRHDINMKTVENCATLSDVKSNGEEEAQENLSTNGDSAHSSNTQENTTSKSEELKETKVDEAPVNVGAESKYSSEQRLDEETKTEQQKPKECHRPVETNSEDLSGEVKEEQDDTSNLDELRRDEVECKENEGERHPDDEERQTKHSEEDEEQMRQKQTKEDFSHRTGEEEGDAERVQNEISVRETSHDINMKTGENCATLSDVKSNGDEEAQENLSTNADSALSSFTQENTTSKSEELKEIKVDEAPVNVGAESKYSSEQRLDEETKTEQQKPKECHRPVETNPEDLSGEVKEEQDDTSNLDEPRRDEVECTENEGERNTDDEERQTKHSEEDEEQMRKKQTEEDFSHRTGEEEGDAERVQNEISVRETSHDINMKTGENCATLSDVKSNGEEEAQEKLSSNEDSTHSSIIPANTNEMKEDDAPLNLGEKTDYSREQRLDEEKKTDKKTQRATECHRPVETNPEDLRGEVKEEQDVTSNLDEPRRDEVGCKENEGERDTDDEERPMEHSEEDEEQMRQKQKNEDFSHQTGEEEGDAESVKKDISVRETSHDINMKTGIDCATLSDVKSNGEEEAQENLSTNADSALSSFTQENKTSKSEELKEIKVDEAPVNVRAESKYSSEQRLDEETKTEQQKSKECHRPVETNPEDLSGEVKEEQDDTSNLDEPRRDEVECKENEGERHPDDEERQTKHSEEDEEQMRKKQTKEDFSHRTGEEEGDAERVQNEISVRETSHDINMKTVENCATLSDVKSNGEEEAQEKLSTNADSALSSFTQENTTSKSEELKEIKVDEAPVNVGAESKYSSEQRLDEETKTEQQKPKATECHRPVETNSEHLMDEVKEEQDEDIILEEQMEGEQVRILIEPSRVCPRSKAQSVKSSPLLFICLVSFVILLALIFLLIFLPLN